MSAAPDGHTRLARLLFADDAAALDEALGRAQARRGERPTDVVEAALDRAATVAREGEFGRAAFAGISGTEAERFARGFALARTVATWAGLSVPDPETFWEEGHNSDALARGLIADASLVPVLAPYGLGSESWTRVFRAAARQPGSPLSLSTPLVLAPEITAEFAALDVPPRAAALARSGGVGWTLRLIPASPQPPLVGLSHAYGPHPTLPEMLMLQLMQIAAGEPPVDRASFTWVAGTIGAGRFAARALFDTSERSVRVNTREIGNQGPHLGARPPVG